MRVITGLDGIREAVGEHLGYSEYQVVMSLARERR